jgi:hypothetical protein
MSLFINIFFHFDIMHCPKCRMSKIDSQFLKFNREGRQVPCRLCKTCRDRQIGYYYKKKLITHKGQDWTLQMDLRSGRRLTLRRANHNTKTSCSNKTELPSPQSANPPPPMAESEGLETEACPVPMETSPTLTEATMSSPPQGRVEHLLLAASLLQPLD